MPVTNVSGFGSASFMGAQIVTDTVTPSAVSLVFLPTVDRVRKARLTFTLGGADTADVTIEFKDERFEEFTMTGQRKEG